MISQLCQYSCGNLRLHHDGYCKRFKSYLEQTCDPGGEIYFLRCDDCMVFSEIKVLDYLDNVWYNIDKDAREKVKESLQELYKAIREERNETI